MRHSVWGDRPQRHNIHKNISPETLIILNRVQACRHTEGTKQTQNSVTKLAREWNVASEQFFSIKGKISGQFDVVISRFPVRQFDCPKLLDCEGSKTFFSAFN